jgi:hypothetical protein
MQPGALAIPDVQEKPPLARAVRRTRCDARLPHA